VPRVGSIGSRRFRRPPRGGTARGQSSSSSAESNVTSDGAASRGSGTAAPYCYQPGFRDNPGAWGAGRDQDPFVLTGLLRRRIASIGKLSWAGPGSARPRCPATVGRGKGARRGGWFLLGARREPDFVTVLHRLGPRGPLDAPGRDAPHDGQSSDTRHPATDQTPDRHPEPPLTRAVEGVDTPPGGYVSRGALRVHAGGGHTPRAVLPLSPSPRRRR
jgi:hypothetical protein